MTRKRKSNPTVAGKMDELELPMYSSVGKSDFEEIVKPKRVYKKGWKNAALY